MPQWTAQQVHDTVAAIVDQSAYSARRSLLSRAMRYLIDRLSHLLSGVQGSLSGRLIVYTAVALIVLVVAARIVVDRRLAEARRAKSGSRARPGERHDFWAAAAAAAEAGRYADACHLVHSAVLDDLTRTGALRWHASKTNGDYARELRRRDSALHPGFKAFASAFERVVFGARAVTRDDYLGLRAAAERLAAARAAA